jgi:uncharacterized protein with FMN-binding domain
LTARSHYWSDGRFGARGQRLLTAVHIMFAGIWLGGIGATALLLWLGAELPRRPDLLIAAFEVHERLVFAAFVGTLTTGLLFSLFTKWGFFTHDWISAKWALALLLFALTLGFQSPALSGVAGLADAGVEALHGHSLEGYRSRAAGLAIGQLSIVVLVYFISTLKPWGRRKPPQVSRTRLLWGTLLPLGLLAAFGVYTHIQLRGYRTMQVEDATAAGLADGVRTGRASCAVPYEVQLRVEGGRIAGLRATRNLDNHYARIAEAVLLRIEHEQHTRVDAITGATTTSKCLMAATADALR